MLASPALSLVPLSLGILCHSQDEFLVPPDLFHLGLLPCGVPCSPHSLPAPPRGSTELINVFLVPLDWVKGPLEITLLALTPYCDCRFIYYMSPAKILRSTRQEPHLIIYIQTVTAMDGPEAVLETCLLNEYMNWVVLGSFPMGSNSMKLIISVCVPARMITYDH